MWSNVADCWKLWSKRGRLKRAVLCGKINQSIYCKLCDPPGTEAKIFHGEVFFVSKKGAAGSGFPVYPPQFEGSKGTGGVPLPPRCKGGGIISEFKELLEHACGQLRMETISLNNRCAFIHSEATSPAGQDNAAVVTARSTSR